MALSGHASLSVILFRMKNQTPRVVTPRLLQVIQNAKNNSLAGAFVIVEDHGLSLAASADRFVAISA